MHPLIIRGFFLAKMWYNYYRDILTRRIHVSNARSGSRCGDTCH